MDEEGPCDLRGGDGSPNSLQSCMGRPGREWILPEPLDGVWPANNLIQISSI